MNLHDGLLPWIAGALRFGAFRLDPGASRSRATGGSGLGLGIVRELARANGWRLMLINRQGGGLEVWLELDRADG
ncbi:ATP-binding protein [Cereibacter sediminicola]|uniref:ATP-binding protein n=1 Tax=Cereibacter sediminicola TaxID=2584941 RepID=UPI0011A7A354|nr:ATP-binding protein [Cereibacter sediminicola]